MWLWTNCNELRLSILNVFTRILMVVKVIWSWFGTLSIQILMLNYRIHDKQFGCVYTNCFITGISRRCYVLVLFIRMDRGKNYFDEIMKFSKLETFPRSGAKINVLKIQFYASLTIVIQKNEANTHKGKDSNDKEKEFWNWKEKEKLD